ncbi:glycosyltransferase family 4 protein [Symmachiella dynata]|uniref:glycosyltransferase family 4 protein n=1 Tax=Symmachiella dynata TaxID=2527995 RepID=UPI0030EE9055
MPSQFEADTKVCQTVCESQHLTAGEDSRQLQRDLVGTGRRVLLVQYSANHSGSTVSGHLIVKGLLAAGFSVDVAFAFDGPYIAKFEHDGASVHVIEHENWLKRGSLLKSFRMGARQLAASRRFAHLIRQIAPDVVYVNSFVSLAPVLAARLAGIPCVWHLRELFDDVGGEMSAPLLGGRRMVNTVLKRLPRRVVAISNAVVNNVLSDLDRNSATVVPNAANEIFFENARSGEECRQELGLPIDRPIIGVPGTLRPVKGHEFLIQSARAVVKACSQSLFVVTGHGSPEFCAYLERLVEDYGLGEHIKFLGTTHDMAAFYRACDIICVPSRSESFGRTVIEAFASRKPVIATAVGGICETIDDGVSGLLVDYADTDGLSQCILSLIADEQLCSRLGNEGRQKAERCFSEQVYHDRIVSIVNDVLH